MIEVFLCTMPTTDLRVAFARTVHAYWRRMDAVRVRVLVPNGFTPPMSRMWWCDEGVSSEMTLPYCPDENFQRERRIYAYAQSAAKNATDPFVIADDDCLPVSPIPDAVEALVRHPSFRELSLLPANANIERWSGDGNGYVPFADDEVFEHVSTGGIRVCRRRHPMEKWEWPAQTGPGYDREFGQMVRDMRERVGYCSSLMLHLGEGYSTVWPQAENAR